MSSKIECLLVQHDPLKYKGVFLDPLCSFCYQRVLFFSFFVLQKGYPFKQFATLIHKWQYNSTNKVFGKQMANFWNK